MVNRLYISARLRVSIALIALSVFLTAAIEAGAQAIPSDRPNAPTAADLAGGALAEYLDKPDASFRWTKIRSGQVGSAVYAELILTSQTWKEILWKHRLFIINPPNAKDAKEAVLLIAGGGWKDEFEDPSHEDELGEEAALLASVAQQFQSPVAVLLHVPQQPIFDDLVEDEIISYTFEKYFQTRDSEWPLLLPMVKSAVRAMDAIQEFCQEEWSVAIDSFTVTGASKRGWTTWLVGASDRRVAAIAPMVIDTLNMARQMDHQIEAWGDYSKQIEDYTKRDLPNKLDTQAGKALLRIVDPFAYRRTLTLPKLLVIGTNDRYWPLDALSLYWGQLVGEKHILYVPNNQHGLTDFPRVLGGLIALHHQTRGEGKLPELSWSFNNGANIALLHMHSGESPMKVQAWVAKSDSRDFRDAQWSATEMSQDNNGDYSYQLDLPETGYAATFGEAVYQLSGDRTAYYLSTNVKIFSPADTRAVPAREP